MSGFRFWSAELWLFAIVTAVLTIVGSFLDVGLWVLLICTAGYLLWHLYHLYQVLHWLSYSRDRYPPATIGIWDDLYNQFYILKKKHGRQKDKLKAIITQFRASTAALPDGAIVINDKSEIIWFNKSAQLLLNLHISKDLGQRITNLVRDPAFIAFEKEAAYEEPLDIRSHLDDTQMLSFTITPYRGGQRLVMIREVTRLHQLEQMRRDFVANVSHELRTPLTVISGYLEMMEASELPPSLEKPIIQMQQQALRMGHLVDDLLLLSRLDSNEIELKTAPVDVNVMADSICAEARALSGDKKQTVLFHSKSELGILGAPKLLRSAFSNLVVNAVRYTPAGGRIMLEWSQQGDELVFSVADNGQGIEPQHLPRLTERFYRVDSARSRGNGGTGLGLAIVKHVLEQHHGHLRIDSEAGKGSRFTCVFPAGLAVTIQ